jgi:hypothetical protein
MSDHDRAEADDDLTRISLDPGRTGIVPNRLLPRLGSDGERRPFLAGVSPTGASLVSPFRDRCHRFVVIYSFFSRNTASPVVLRHVEVMDVDERAGCERREPHKARDDASGLVPIESEKDEGRGMLPESINQSPLDLPG